MEKILQLLLTNVLYLVGTIGAIVVLGLVLILYKRAEAWGQKVLENWKDSMFVHGRINKAMQEIITNLNNDLSALRGEFNADRAYIFEFHNGTEFASKIPQWKISKTYEKVRGGITYEGHGLQNLPATLIWDDYLKIFFNQRLGDGLPSGISRYVRNPSCKEGCKLPRSVYLINVASMDMSGGPVKALFEKQGIYNTIQTPIVTAKGHVVGFVGLDYCDDEDIDTRNIDSCKLCRFASQVALSWELDKFSKDRIFFYQKKFLNKK